MKMERRGCWSISAVADESLDTITSEKIAGYARRRQDAGMKVATVNRELQVLRRMFALAMEWGKVERILPRVRMIPGEAHRDRIISVEDEKAYLEAAQVVGTATMEAYQRALLGIRASQRGATPIKPRDPFLLRDVATILLDCGVRPEERFRLRWDNYQSGVIEITHGKTDNARRRIPLSQRAQSMLEMRRGQVEEPWIFPAPTKSGHIEYLLEALGTLHGPLDTCLPRWASRHVDHETVRAPAGI
jgi:integrase